MATATEGRRTASERNSRAAATVTPGAIPLVCCCLSRRAALEPGHY